MATVIEYEATREQVIEFRADVEKVMQSFKTVGGQAVPGTDTRDLIHWVREKWDAQRQTKGRRMPGSGFYGHLNEAILRLPRLTQPKSWFSGLYDAKPTAPFIGDE